MTHGIPPIVDERRYGERRADWHTPNDCYKLLDVQTAMDKIFARLKEGDDKMDSIFAHFEEANIRMGCLEDNVAGNHRIVSADIKSLETMLEDHKKVLDDNTLKTDRIFEIVEMGEGLFKTTKFIGKWLRKAIMWVVPPITAVVTLWYTFTSHK